MYELTETQIKAFAVRALVDALDELGVDTNELVYPYTGRYEKAIENLFGNIQEEDGVQTFVDTLGKLMGDVIKEGERK